MATKLKRITQKIEEEIQRGEKEKTLNPFSSACRHITRPRRIPVDAKIRNAKTKTKTKFAFISFNKFNTNDFEDDFIPLCGQCRNQKKIGTEKCYKEFLRGSFQDGRNCQRGLDVEACGRRLLKLKAKPRVANWRHYQEALAEALDISDVDVVVVNELGIPASPTGPSAEFVKQIKSWAEKTSSLIIAGSFHDARTKYNTGYIFTPSSPDNGYAFHKQVSATDINEYISVPAKRQSVIVPAFGFNIGVIICLDLLDYSTVASLVDMRDAIDFILVPSHSDAEGMQSLRRVAKIASQAIPGGVGIINCNDGQLSSSTMHIFGDLREPDVDRQLKDGSGRLSIYEVDWQWFTNEKKSGLDVPLDIDWLFRYPIVSRA